MGSSVSQQIMAAASESISIINNQTQNCVQQGSQAEVISICAGGAGCSANSNVNISGVNFQESAIYTTQCMETVNITTDIQNQISMAFQQAAEAIAQQFQLSGASVNQVANISAMIGETIRTDTVQNCVQRVSQTEGIVVSCGKPGQGGVCNINIEQVTFAEGFQPINNCILQDTQTQGIINQVSQTISQQGTAKTESIFGPLGALILIILVIVGFVLYKGSNAITDWRLWVVVIVLLLIYLALAYALAWFPFEHASS